MAKVNLTQETIKINGFEDIYAVDDYVTRFRSRLRVIRDLLTREDGGLNDNDSFNMSTTGALGMALLLDDCEELVESLFHSCWNASKTSTPKTKKPTRPDSSVIPASISNRLSNQAGVINEVINILTLIEDHHFTNLKTPPPCSDEAERIGTLITVSTSKLYQVKADLEEVSGQEQKPFFDSI